MTISSCFSRGFGNIRGVTSHEGSSHVRPPDFYCSRLEAAAKTCSQTTPTSFVTEAHSYLSVPKKSTGRRKKTEVEGSSVAIETQPEGLLRFVMFNAFGC